MPTIESSLITTLLGLAGTLLGLAILVQVLQEFYKYLSSSKSAAYTQALIDFLGPWGQGLLRSGGLPDMRVRGPFQFRRLGPSGKLLPLDKTQLVSGLERTLPPWVSRALEFLNAEQALQSTGPQIPSPEWGRFLDELGKADVGSPGYWSALDIAKFLVNWGHQIGTPHTAEGEGPADVTTSIDNSDTLALSRGDDIPRNIGAIYPPETIDISRLLPAFRHEFLAHIDDAAERFPQLQTNFEYAYERRNSRQTFVFALLVTVLLGLPINRVYNTSRQMSPEEASSLAQNMIDSYDRYKQIPLPPDSTKKPDTTMEKRLKLAQDVLGNLLDRYDTTGKGNSDQRGFPGLQEFTDASTKGTVSLLLYFCGCLVTALLVSFGAPFWNDIASALLRLQKGSKPAEPKPKEGDNG